MSRIVLQGVQRSAPRTINLVDTPQSPPSVVVTAPPPQPPQPTPTPTPTPTLTTPGWSDKRAAAFLLGKLDKALQALNDPTRSTPADPPTASQFWEYFLLLKNSGAEVGAETSNALLSILATIGSVGHAARTVSLMEASGVTIENSAGADLVAAYARETQYSAAFESFKHFSSDDSTLQKGFMDATFSKLETPSHSAHNRFARALLDEVPKQGLGALERNHFISVAKGSVGGEQAWQVLNAMKREGRGEIQGGDALGSLSWACGSGRDVEGALKTVGLAEARDSTNVPCYEGLALAHRGRADVAGSSATLDRFAASGHSLDSASFLLQTVALTAAPPALKGDSRAKDLCKKVYETTMESNIPAKENLTRMLKKVVQ